MLVALTSPMGNKDLTTIAVWRDTRQALEQFEEREDFRSAAEAVAFLIWYHDLIVHLNESPENAAETAKWLAGAKRQTPVSDW